MTELWPYWATSSHIESYLVILRHWCRQGPMLLPVLLNITVLWILPNSTEFHWISLNITELYRNLIKITENLRILWEGLKGPAQGSRVPVAPVLRYSVPSVLNSLKSTEIDVNLSKIPWKSLKLTEISEIRTHPHMPSIGNCSIPCLWATLSWARPGTPAAAGRPGLFIHGTAGGAN